MPLRLAVFLLAPAPAIATSIVLFQDGASDALASPVRDEETLLRRADRMPPSAQPDPKRTLPWPFPGEFRDQNLWNNYQQASGGGVHAGLDLIQDAGTEVRAVDDGWVALVATNYPDWTTHHMLIVAEEKGGTVGWTYTHLDPSRYTVEIGDRVKRGQVLGVVGEFSIGDRPGADHLHLDYVRFAYEPSDAGTWDLKTLIDPLRFFDAPDERDPEVAPLRLAAAGTWQEFEQDDGDLWRVRGRVDVLAAIRDQSYDGGAGNWGVPVITLEVRSVRGRSKWCKLVLDHRGPIGDRRQARPLYDVSEAGFAWRRALGEDPDYGPWPSWQVLRVTATDGDGTIEPGDASFAWDTTELAEGERPRFPDGLYDVTVRAFDLAGNVGSSTARVRVENDGSTDGGRR
ncbi:MAG: M23 family metallopeptidase [Planctomycetota bacterium]